MQQIYSKYKERFIEINSKNRNIYTRKINNKINYDLGKILSKTSLSDFEDFINNRINEFNIINDRNVNFNNEVIALKKLKNEVEELQKETGKYDLYLGFPFVYAQLKSGLNIKAPIYFFPVELNIKCNSVSLIRPENASVVINKNLISALQIEYKFCYDEYKNIVEQSCQNFNINDLLRFFDDNGIRIKLPKTNRLISFDEKAPSTIVTLKNIALIGRFCTSTAIYDDYALMEQKNITNPAIYLLLTGKSPKEKAKKSNLIYHIGKFDYSQDKVLKMIDSGTNLVVYGPPGTGKSQTIANIIGNALCKNLKVLVVSEKQVALDVVFSRLGMLNDKAIQIPDLNKDKESFYKRISFMHEQLKKSDTSLLEQNYKKSTSEINSEYKRLLFLQSFLQQKSSFGMSPQEMYTNSYNIGKNSTDYELYEKLKNTSLISYNYNDLKTAISYIENRNLCETFLQHNKYIDNNPLIRHLKNDIDMYRVKECIDFLEKKQTKHSKPYDFRTSDYGHYVATLIQSGQFTIGIPAEDIAKMIIKNQHKELYNAKKLCIIPVFWAMVPLVFSKYSKLKKEIVNKIKTNESKLTEIQKDYNLLRTILDDEGYVFTIENILTGNVSSLKLLLSALNNYTSIQDIKSLIDDLSPLTKEILSFCYNNSAKTAKSMTNILSKVMSLRIYHEVVELQQNKEYSLKEITDFENVVMRIISLREQQISLSKEIALNKINNNYIDYCQNTKNFSNYIYQLKKQKDFWNLRKFMDNFGDYLLKLFPCWLLSPQNVCEIFPLKRDIFDIVIFDEASQIFIENALPSIYRGKSIIVSGDNKQLRPSISFLRHYQGYEQYKTNLDLSTEEALEATSLLDLAEAKFTAVNLTYHYRSDHADLIAFSNSVFYNNKLEIVPDVDATDSPAIERIKVDGCWNCRKNKEEAMAVVKLVKNLLTTRKNNESIGIITFNLEQKDCLIELFEKAAEQSPDFSKLYYHEKNRIENGENHSIFIKNLENVQGDERDIIIFSIGYAKNSSGKINCQFGALSAENGENRLNVAITRAKKKIYIVTSIEPEELFKVEQSKHAGPKLLQKYLMYARAVSSGKIDEKNKILDNNTKNNTLSYNIANSVKDKLEKFGYHVYKDLGSSSYRLPLAIYDDNLKKFILGIEFDFQDFTFDNIISHQKFFTDKGWKIFRVWSRDWWISQSKVIDNIIEVVEEEKRRLKIEAS